MVTFLISNVTQKGNTMTKKYYKAMNSDLTGRFGTQYEVGKTFYTGDDDDWTWFHYTDNITDTLHFYHTSDVRFCEVKPLGKIVNFGRIHPYYWTTNRIEIVREIPRDEIYEMLLEEKCNTYFLLRLYPPFEILSRCKTHNRGWSQSVLTQHPGLTIAEKEQLLPKKYHDSIKAFPYKKEE